MDTLQECYYISTGRKQKLYTLRYKNENLHFLEDSYCCTLSNDWDVAIKKAERIAGTVPLITNHLKLGKITKRSREELEKEQEVKQLEIENFKRIGQEQDNEILDIIKSGVFPFGKHKGKNIIDIAIYDKSYILYMGKPLEDTTTNNIKKALNAKVIELCPSLFSDWNKCNGDYYPSEKGKRTTIVATLFESFSFSGFYGPVHVEKFKADSGELIVYMGSGVLGFNKEDGDFEVCELTKTYNFDAMIKDKVVYNNEKQTKVARITKLSLAKVS